MCVLPTTFFSLPLKVFICPTYHCWKYFNDFGFDVAFWLINFQLYTLNGMDGIILQYFGSFHLLRYYYEMNFKKNFSHLQ